ncbi:MAG: hypothetical protein HC822_00350 [Oscillochloris sp.]|nr:hypothetical protein [Oscillochloris sp.]
MNKISTVTNPESAWLIAIVPSALAVAAVLIVVLLLREQCTLWLAQLQHRHATNNPANLPDPALLRRAEPLAPQHLLLIALVSALLTAAFTALIAPIWLALVCAGPLSIALTWVAILVGRHRYVDALERELTETVGRWGALLRAGVGFRTALDRLVSELPAGPLHDEWEFLLSRQGVPLSSGGIATAQQVVAALATQTMSHRHATFLDHLAVAVGQPQDVLAQRVGAAYAALQASNRRREEALTELSQIRYSGMAVGLAGIVMALYLLWTQWERALAAYSSPLGLVIATIVAGALGLPMIGGFLLARAEDIDY